MTRTPAGSTIVIAKRESVDHGLFGFWSRHLRLTVHRGGKDSFVDTDEATFDRVTIGSNLPAPGKAAPAVASGPQRVAKAIVQNVRIRPWGISKTVDLSFVPEGRTEPVIAVDEIDLSSVPGLAANTTATVIYPISNPRIALISGATRHFRWVDPLGGWSPMVLLLAAMLLLVTLTRSVRSAKAAKAQPPG